MAVYTEDVYYDYAEFLSQRNQHHFQRQIQQVWEYAQPGCGRCVVCVLDKYLRRLPRNLYTYMDVFDIILFAHSRIAGNLQ